MIDFDTFKKLPKNVGDLAKLIVAKGFKKLPKVQKIAKSCHTVGKGQLKGASLTLVRKIRGQVLKPHPPLGSRVASLLMFDDLSNPATSGVACWQCDQKKIAKCL